MTEQSTQCVFNQESIACYIAKSDIRILAEYLDLPFFKHALLQLRRARIYEALKE